MNEEKNLWQNLLAEIGAVIPILPPLGQLSGFFPLYIKGEKNTHNFSHLENLEAGAGPASGPEARESRKKRKWLLWAALLQSVSEQMMLEHFQDHCGPLSREPAWSHF